MHTEENSGISRVQRSKAEAQRAYDRMSNWYDLLAGSSEAHLTRLGLAKLAARPTERVLEIGCGTGHALKALASATGPSGQTLGIDLSMGMATKSRKRLRGDGREPLPGSVALADALQLPFRAGHLDAIFLGFVLELFDTPEIPAVLAECQRVLNARGRIAVVAMSKLGKGNLMRRAYEWAHARFPQTVDCRPIFAARSLEQAGFRIVETQSSSTWGLPVEIVLANKG